jgi:hypothetical protein
VVFIILATMRKLLTFFALFFLVSCSKQVYIADQNKPCPTTRDINYVCGSDNITYVNPSTAKCNKIYIYTKGKCND